VPDTLPSEIAEGYVKRAARGKIEKNPLREAFPRRDDRLLRVFDPSWFASLKLPGDSEKYAIFSRSLRLPHFSGCQRVSAHSNRVFPVLYGNFVSGFLRRFCEKEEPTTSAQLLQSDMSTYIELKG
jgi:hypothetical protein